MDNLDLERELNRQCARAVGYEPSPDLYVNGSAAVIIDEEEFRRKTLNSLDASDHIYDACNSNHDAFALLDVIRYNAEINILFNLFKMNVHFENEDGKIIFEQEHTFEENNFNLSVVKAFLRLHELKDGDIF